MSGFPTTSEGGPHAAAHEGGVDSLNSYFARLGAANTFTTDQLVQGALNLTLDQSAAVTPLINLNAISGNWQIGIDTANHGGGSDFFIGKKVGAATTDVIFINYSSTAIGLGATPPLDTYRVEIAGIDSSNTFGELLLRVGPTQTAKAFAVMSSAGTEQVWITSDFYVSGINQGLNIQADAGNARTIVSTNNAKSASFGWSFPAATTFRLSYITGGVNIVDFASTGAGTWYTNQAFNAGATVQAAGGGLTLADTANVVLSTGTGTKIGTGNTQKLGLWDAPPTVQATTGIAAGTFVTNTSGILNDSATFRGYTIGQIAQALWKMGILA